MIRAQLLLVALASGASLAQALPSGYYAYGKPVGCNCRSVAWLGDSITEGGSYCTPSPAPPSILYSTGVDGPVANFGVSGNTVSQMRARWVSTIRPARYDRLVFLGGVNDLIQGGVASTIWPVLKSILDEARLDGMRVTPLTVMPWKHVLYDWTVGKQAETDSLNASILQWCTDNHETCVDANASFADPMDNDLLLVAYSFGDGVHLNSTGCNHLATIVEAALP